MGFAKVGFGELSRSMRGVCCWMITRNTSMQPDRKCGAKPSAMRKRYVQTLDLSQGFGDFGRHRVCPRSGWLRGQKGFEGWVGVYKMENRKTIYPLHETSVQVINIGDVKETIIEKIKQTFILIIIVFCDLIVVLSILFCVFVIGHISSVFGMNTYPINILPILSEIGLIVIFIIFIIADAILTYKIHLKQ